MIRSHMHIAAVLAVACLGFASSAPAATEFSRSETMALADYQTLVDSLIRDSSGIITTTERDTAIALAVARYSEDRPEQSRADVVGDGTNFVNLPNAWEQDFSRIVAIE